MKQWLVSFDRVIFKIMSGFDLLNQFTDIELENDRSQNDFRNLFKGVDLKPDESKKVIDCSLFWRDKKLRWF